MTQRNHPPSRKSNSSRPVLALLSDDEQLAKMVDTLAVSKWSIIKPGMAKVATLIREPNVKLIIFDDECVGVSDRGWALTEIRRCASKASIIYVAGDHDHENERQARTRGVLFYTAKPLIPDDVGLLIQRLLQKHDDDGNLASR